MHKRKGQSILEYTVIMVIVLGVVIAMRDYVKRGIQGRWKSSTDEMGDQYDPQHLNSDINVAVVTNSVSTVSTVNGTDSSTGTVVAGQWTNRMDQSNSTETKTGYTQVGS